MSKLYDLYLKKKEINKDKIYLFRNGNFYLAFGDDAIILSEELGLKLTVFSKETNKCGFPIKGLEKYTKFIKLLNLDFEIVLDVENQIILDIKSLENISKKEALEKIKYYQELLKDEVL